MIENSDRGVTLNKPLAWTMFVAVVTLVWYGGTTVTMLQASSDALLQSVLETRAMIAAERESSLQLESRIRVLESSASRQDARFDAFSQSLEELKSAQRETNELLRQLATGTK